MDEFTKKVAGMSQDELIKHYQTCFGTDSGRVVLEDLRMTFFKRASTAYVENDVGDGIKELVHVSTDVLQRNEGMRIALLHIDTKVEHQPEREEHPQESEQ